EVDQEAFRRCAYARAIRGARRCPAVAAKPSPSIPGGTSRGRSKVSHSVIPAVQRIAVLGAGHVGPVIARLALDAGFDVAIAASGSPENLELITQVVVPGVEARWAADAVAASDVVVLAIPLHRFPALDPAQLSGKLVVDAMNYWAPADGVVPMFQGQELSSSEIVQRRLSRSTVIKSLN